MGKNHIFPRNFFIFNKKIIKNFIIFLKNYEKNVKSTKFVILTIAFFIYMVIMIFGSWHSKKTSADIFIIVVFNKTLTQAKEHRLRLFTESGKPGHEKASLGRNQARAGWK